MSNRLDSVIQYEREDSMFRFSGRYSFSYIAHWHIGTLCPALNITKHGDIDEFIWLPSCASAE
jgi:hypothetical protein